MIYTFTFSGNTPSKKNQKQIFRSKSGTPFISTSAAHKAWHREAAWLLKGQLAKVTGPFPLTRCKSVVAQIYYADERGRDNSNIWESIADLLVDVGILEDDKWRVTGTTAQVPALRKGAPGWVVVITTEDTPA